MPLIAEPENAPAAFQAAWNAHDMTAFGALFHDDASFVTRFGRYMRGVDEIVGAHRSIHETIYRDSTLTNEVVAADRIADDAAVVQFWSRLSIAEAHPAGAHQIDTLILTVLTRRDGSWRIQALSNVPLSDPRTGQPVLR